MAPTTRRPLARGLAGDERANFTAIVDSADRREVRAGTSNVLTRLGQQRKSHRCLAFRSSTLPHTTTRPSARTSRDVRLRAGFHGVDLHTEFRRQHLEHTHRGHRRGIAGARCRRDETTESGRRRLDREIDALGVEQSGCRRALRSTGPRSRSVTVTRIVDGYSRCTRTDGDPRESRDRAALPRRYRPGAEVCLLRPQARRALFPVGDAESVRPRWRAPTTAARTRRQRSRRARPPRHRRRGTPFAPARNDPTDAGRCRGRVDPAFGWRRASRACRLRSGSGGPEPAGPAVQGVEDLPAEHRHVARTHGDHDVAGLGQAGHLARHRDRSG